MALIAEVVAGSEEPLFVDLKINGSEFDITAYSVTEMTATLTDGTAVTIAGTLVADATVANPSRVKFTPSATDFAHSSADVPLEPTKYYVRFWAEDGDGVELSFPRGAKDHIDVYAT